MFEQGGSFLASFYSTITINDVDKDEKGNPVGVRGIPWEQMHVQHLCTIYSRLSVKGVKNDQKSYIIETLNRWCYNKWNYYNVMKVAYDDSQTAGTQCNKLLYVVPKTTRKEVHNAHFG
jgi:hypothetical protein